MNFEIALREHDITDDDTLVFLHLPKTAGITLGNLIDPMWLPHARCPYYDMREMMNGDIAHVRAASSFVGHYYYSAVNQLTHGAATRITFFREPIARYISEFRYVQRQPLGSPEKQHPERTIVRSLALDEFVWRSDLRRYKMMLDVQTRWLGTPLVFESLVDLRRVWRHANETISTITATDAQATLKEFVTFGLTEFFQESLWMLCFVFGWYPLENNAMLNRAPRVTRPDEIQTETLNQIAALNRQDLELYATVKKIFQERYAWLMQTLLERYGARQHAHATLPLSHKPMRELLIKHFHARYQARHAQQTPRAIQFCFDGNAESAMNWHGREHSPAHGWFRWTGPTKTSWLVLPCPSAQDIRLQFRVLHVLQEDLLNSLHVSANGAALVLQRNVDADGTSIFRAQIPAQVVRAQPYVLLEWRVAKTLRPLGVEENNSDERELGIAISEIELAPIAQT